MKKEDKITVIEMQKFFNKHNTGLRLGKREFDAINEIIAVSQFPVQEQSKQEVTEDTCGYGYLFEVEGNKRLFVIEKNISEAMDYLERLGWQDFELIEAKSIPILSHASQEQKDTVTGVSDAVEFAKWINCCVYKYGKLHAPEFPNGAVTYEEAYQIFKEKSITTSEIKEVEQKEPDEWVEYDFRKLHTRPNKYGKYFVCRKDGKTHWETWNGSGWAYNENSIAYWKEILPPNKFFNHGLNKEPNGWVSDGCFYPNDGTHIANELATPVYFHPPIQEAEHKQDKDE